MDNWWCWQLGFNLLTLIYDILNSCFNYCWLIFLAVYKFFFQICIQFRNIRRFQEKIKEFFILFIGEVGVTLMMYLLSSPLIFFNRGLSKREILNFLKPLFDCLLLENLKDSNQVEFLKSGFECMILIH